MPLIYQYGSNCDTARLKERLGDADDLGRAQTLDEYDIGFNVWSQTNGCAAADLVAALGTGRHAWGVLYAMSDAAVAKLRKIEGPRYEEKSIRVQDKGGNEITRPVTTFLVKPKERRHGLWTSAEYVGHIVTGLRVHGVQEVDPGYIQHVIDIAIETNRRAAQAAEEQIQRIEELRGRRGSL